ncbi:MAG: hypothetical protein D6794_03510 [Deltaproteobacteria bacterium]|nr:MAG: hypothetical protein D6794_03510 [Deltaproteobacteria bacterium]
MVEEKPPVPGGLQDLMVAMLKKMAGASGSSLGWLAGYDRAGKRTGGVRHVPLLAKAFVAAKKKVTAARRAARTACEICG